MPYSGGARGQLVINLPQAIWFLTYSLADAILSDELINHFLNGHNEIRRKIANGTALNDNGTLPSAKNMYDMVFSGELEHEAEILAVKCSSRVRASSPAATNIKLFNDQNHTLLDDAELVKIALNEWYAPVKKHGLHDDNNTYNDLRLESFANMIYYKNNYFGCTLHRCNTGSTRSPVVAVIVCVYMSAPIYGAPLYESGNACQKDRDCTLLPESKCEEGLCWSFSVLTPPEPNDICPQNVNMTDTLRKRFHTAHNNLRSKLAKGDIYFEGKGRLPSAGDMYYMTYDCDLEAGAQQHASGCSLRPSSSSSRKDVGENTRVIAGVNRYPELAAEKALKEWWNEVRESAPNPEMKFTEEMSYQKHNTVQHFTQMIWARSHRLGCGMQICAGKMFVVCRYAERGNGVGRHIYHVGSPCEFCPKSCVAKVGLCRPPT
ncbi:hypothetical protein Aduo_017132 [Ancylostoma duodenale]